MVAERKSVTIHYRKFNRPKTVPHSLENLIRDAMNSTGEGGTQVKNRYLARLLKLGTDNYFINIYNDGSGSTALVFGDILHFTKGHLQALCQTADDSAASVPVHQMKAPEQSEYVHSQMFWMVKGDHVFVVQSLSLRTAEFEQYLDWLLKTKTTQLSTEHPIILDAKFDEDEVGGDLSDIQEIIIGGVVAHDTQKNDVASMDQVREVTQRGQIDTGKTTGRDTAKAVLKTLLGGDAQVASIMSAVPPDAELNVQVHIGYQTKKRKVDRVALRNLESGLRNLDDSQLQVKAKGARVASDGTIRLHHNASIKLIKALDGDKQVIGTLLDPADVLRAAVEAYSNFLANGKIQEE